MALVEELASFVVNASYDHLSDAARQQLKIRILDSLGCAVGALSSEPAQLIRRHLEDFGGRKLCTLIGGGSTAPDRAALYNSALVRYLDFNDTYLASGEACHPSDNLGAVLAACQYAGGSGKDLLTALAVAYQVQTRLSDVAPVRAKGFDHTTQGSYAVAAGVSKALGLDAERTAHALAISGTAFNALRVTRTGALSHWKGLAYPNTAACCTQAAFLAMHGITGPREVFEGNKGFMDAISGPFHIDWSREDLERVNRTIIKKYNAEAHSQTAIEGVMELKVSPGFDPSDVARVEVETFDAAYNIIGGGEEGGKKVVRTKEEADHSLPYIVAVAILDGEVTPEQYLPDRIHRDDVQALLQKVVVRTSESYSSKFPNEMPCLLKIFLKDGKLLTTEKRGYEGFHSRPVQWSGAVAKFERLSCSHTSVLLRGQIVDAVSSLESIRVADLARLLGRVKEAGAT